MAKMKIEIRRPQAFASKEPVIETKEVKPKRPAQKTPFVFRLLIFATCALSALAMWFVYLKYAGRA